MGKWNSLDHTTSNFDNQFMNGVPEVVFDPVGVLYLHLGHANF